MNKNNHITSGIYLEYPLHQENTYITEYLDKLYSIFSSITTQYKRTFYIRFDLRFPAKHEYDNNAISKFFTKLNAILKSKRYNQHSAKYLWVREQDSSKLPHYHCVLFLDYSKTRSAGCPNGPRAGGLMKVINDLWCSILDTESSGMVHLASSNPIYKYIDRDNVKSKQEIFKHCAYLCKVKTKAYNIAGKNIGCSQIKSNNQK
ncbi:inovirus Gp2 family protein [Vibrio vulnificus]|nr:inovirus Gp2 family protein [Vibrio vulnificus]MCU8111741.1 inovirus Gp2 family protein [Vibrio vulnificus]